MAIRADLVESLPRSTSGFSYSFSVMNCFSKFILLFPIRTATTANNKWLEEQVFFIYGTPDNIIVDNGTQYRSDTFKSLMSKYNVEIQFTVNYHSQSNPVEYVLC